MAKNFEFPATDPRSITIIRSSREICLQNFLFEYAPIGMETLWGHSSHPVKRSETKISGNYIPENTDVTVSFDGLANQFPVDYFRLFSTITRVRLTTFLVADSAHLSILQTSPGGKTTLLFDQKITNFSGKLSTDWIDINNLNGSLHLQVIYRGSLEISQTAWIGESETAIPSPSTLLSITAFKRDEFVLPLLESLCCYGPLSLLDLKILVVDNGGTLAPGKMPNDPRLLFVPQENLGCTSGVMRALTIARDLNTDFMVIADDDIVLPPEMLYRLFIFQIVSNRPISVGAGMLTLQNPDMLWEKGSQVLSSGLNALKPLHKRTHLGNPENINSLFKVDNPDYTALWLMSAPTSRLSFLPAFFIYYEDVLQGLLLKKNGVQIVVPPHIFLWHATLEKRGAFWKRYLWVRNDLATRYLNPEKLRPISVAFSFLNLMTKLIMSYDYKLANYHLRAFKEAITDSSWAMDPLGEKGKTDALIRENPAQIDLSPNLPTGFHQQSQEKGPRIFRIARRLAHLLTLGNYLNPFCRSVRPDGTLPFRFHGDYESWGWFGYSTLAVVDRNGLGYLCKRSWKEAIQFLFPCLALSFRFLVTQRNMIQKYSQQSENYEKAWREAFSVLDGKKIQKLS